MRNKKGFTMVELLVVLVIVAILAAVATPIYLANVQRSRASEAVSTMALIRQSERDYQISGTRYFNVSAIGGTGTIVDPLPTSVAVANGDPTPPASGLNIESGVAQYFANTAFSVDTTAVGTNGVSGRFGGVADPNNPPVVDFLITATGANGITAGDNTACVAATTIDCATKSAEVANYVLEMDNSGRTYVTYDITAVPVAWEAY